MIEEFINGVTLEEYRESRRVLTEEQVCSIVSDLCDALSSEQPVMRRRNSSVTGRRMPERMSMPWAC